MEDIRDFTFFGNILEDLEGVSKEDRDRMIVYAVEYGAYGIEPELEGFEAVTFKRIKRSIDQSVKARSNGGKGGRGNKKPKSDPEKNPGLETDKPVVSEPENLGLDDDEALIISNQDISNRIESIPPISPFAIQCLNALNEEFGTTYASMPDKCGRTLQRFEGKYDLEAVKAMLRYKREEWQGTKYRNCLTPNTLFSPDHFEQYIHQAMTERKEAETYAVYDR